MEKIENQLLIKIQIFWRELALPSADKQPAIDHVSISSQTRIRVYWPQKQKLGLPLLML